jgi:nucleotide-binding universal stress UspA family protein
LIDEVIEGEQAEAASYLRQMAARLSARGFTVSAAQLEGSAGDAIVAYAREHQIDLVALTTHGHGGLGRIVFGSVAEHVLRHAPCPVLLERARESDESTAIAP